jgi:signal transduction histidine kinase
MSRTAFSSPETTAAAQTQSRAAAATVQPASGIFEIDLADSSLADMGHASAALAASLIARTRTILWLSLLTGLSFTALEVLAVPPRIAAPFFVKCVGISSITAALMLVRGAWAVRHARLLAIVVITAAYLLTALSGIVSPSREYETTAVLFVTGALTTAVLLPWGLWPQLATVLVGAASLGVAVLHADGDFHQLSSDPPAAVVIGFVLSVVAAYEIQRYRVGVIRELTARRRAEEEVRALNTELERRVIERTTQLRALSARLQSVREEERTCLAREIHDELGQELTALKLHLDFLPKRIDGVHTPAGRESLQQNMTDMSALAGTLIDSVRRIATELRPAALDDLGLRAAIAWHAHEFERHFGVRCVVACEPDTLALDPLRATALFRIVQEALTNVARHAAAQAASITLRSNADAVLLEVKDDGRGITDHALRGTNSLGLLGIRERAQLLGGTVDIWGVPGRGTTVRVRLPWQESDQPHRPVSRT